MFDFVLLIAVFFRNGLVFNWLECGGCPFGWPPFGFAPI